MRTSATPTAGGGDSSGVNKGVNKSGKGAEKGVCHVRLFKRYSDTKGHISTFVVSLSE